MRRNNLVWFCVAGLLMHLSCIRPFDPEILAEDERKYVVSGDVILGDEIQRVNISITSPIEAPEYIPVEGCEVTISDNQGNTFSMEDKGNGDYETVMAPEYLVPGHAYRLEVLTPAGDRIMSAYDTLKTGPEVDTVYYFREDLETNNPDVYTLGIQFYVDLHAQEGQSHFYRWEPVETWEYHADYPKEWYYDGEVHHIFPPDSSRMVCWSTQSLPNIYTLTTDHLVENQYERIPLHYVNNLTSRLAYGYSLLIRQYALSEAAYVYWDQLRINSDREGGLYEKQPLAIRGNMQCVNKPEQDVLGFFSAASVSEKRIFVDPIPDLPLYFTTYCDYVDLRTGLHEIPPAWYPAYLYGNEFGYSYRVIFIECVDCTILGGVHIKPAFWPH